METLKETFIPELGTPKRGKVRDVYEGLENLLIVTCDRISAFNRCFEETIPHKGEILNAISKFWFDATQDIIQNHLVAMPDPNVLVVEKCQPIPIEIIVRGYLAGSMWRDYKNGSRIKCGISLPEGLTENDKLPAPIVTPTLKNENDTEVTEQQIIEQGLISIDIWKQIINISQKLFDRGTEIAKDKGLTLVDTKYEFGINYKGDLVLIDELHTPDSSRYWYQDQPGISYDKEYLRQWLLANPQSEALTADIVEKVRLNYEHLYQSLLGKQFIHNPTPIEERLINNLVLAEMIYGFLVIAVGEENSVQNIPCKVIKHDSETIRNLDHSMEPLIFIASQEIHTKWPVVQRSEMESMNI